MTLSRDDAPTSRPPAEFFELLDDERPTLPVPELDDSAVESLPSLRPPPVPREFQSGLRARVNVSPLLVPLLEQKRDIEHQLKTATAWKRGGLLRDLARVKDEIKRHEKRSEAK
jgi:hypothetical protein